MKPEIKLALEILRNEMRVVEARLEDAIDHERELRILHGHAYDRMRNLLLSKADLIGKSQDIEKAHENTQNK